MPDRRKLEALRNLAERPGTPAEGKLAREFLARLEDKRFNDKPEDERDAWKAFSDHLRGKTSTDEYIDAMRQWSGRGIYHESEWTDRGARVLTSMVGQSCPRCNVSVEPGVEHLCGDRAPKVSPKPRKGDVHA